MASEHRVSDELLSRIMTDGTAIVYPSELEGAVIPLALDLRDSRAENAHLRELMKPECGHKPTHWSHACKLPKDHEGNHAVPGCCSWER